VGRLAARLKGRRFDRHLEIPFYFIFIFSVTLCIAWSLVVLVSGPAAFREFWAVVPEYGKDGIFCFWIHVGCLVSASGIFGGLQGQACAVFFC